ncbi:glycoside hydrolase family 65 protein [Vibrio mimicus]
MLIISYGKQTEEIIKVNSVSSAFVACVTTLANSHMGMRPYVPESSARTKRTQLLVSDIYVSGIGVSREIVSLPVPRIIRLYDVDTGEYASHMQDTTTVVLSLEKATVSSTERMRVGGTIYELTVRQFVDTPDVPAASIYIELYRVDCREKPHRVRLDFGIDDSALNEYLGTSEWLTARHYDIKQSFCDKDNLSVIVETREQQRLGYNICFESSQPFTSSIISWNEERSCVASITIDFATNKHQQLFAHWQLVRDPHKSVSVYSSSTINYPDIANEHQKMWSTIWNDHEVIINSRGSPIELGMKYAIFQLLQHGVGTKNNDRGVLSPARGLTSTYHSGATFFDTDLHKCIFWLWNDPDKAKALIDYRYDTIEEARLFAQASSFAGARYPEASNDMGTENGPHYVLSYPDLEVRREWSVKEVLHISADVCYVLNKYWVVTGDDAYMESRGYQIIVESAKFAASVFSWSEQKQAYVLYSVMGPDEYHYHVDNSFFTNYMLRWNIRLALSMVGRRGFPEVPATQIELWHAMADNIYLPWMMVEGVSIPEEFEGYASLPDTQLRVDKKRGPQFVNDAEREQAEKLQNFASRLVKQADIVLLMSLFPDHFSDIVKRTAFNYYEPRTVHESSLSYGPHSVVAAHLGKMQTCADFMLRASRYNLDFSHIADYSNGLHLSAYAGAWQGLVEGLSGLDVKEGRLSFRPQLPSHWDSCHFTLYFRGQRLKVSILGQGELEIHRDGLKLATSFNHDASIGLEDECL